MVNSPLKNTCLALKFKRLTTNARPPVRSSPQAAGVDLCSAQNVTIAAKARAVVATDLSISLPDGCYGRIAPRSGLASKHFIDVGAGVIDADYRGNVGVLLFNFGDQDFQINQGDRIAQLICEKIVYAEPQEVQEISDTQRGDGGFGSTGF